MSLIQRSPGKINLLLNVLGKRSDGFHELESVLYPLPLEDLLEIKRAPCGIELTCNEPNLPIGSSNLVWRAAEAFLSEAKIREGIRIHLEKRVPLSAGLGGGSSNAAGTLRGLNQLFGNPLPDKKIVELAERIGSDVPFFLQNKPALATGRGEKVVPLESRLAALEETFVALVYPGFGVSTMWAYQKLANYPDALNGQGGRAAQLIQALQDPKLSAAARHFYNSLEGPVLKKYPILALYQEFLRGQGALVTLMSGSGSATFAFFSKQTQAEQACRQLKEKFGGTCWTAVLRL